MDAFRQIIWQNACYSGKSLPDFLVHGGKEPLVVEVGGQGKGRQQFKDVTVGRKLVFAETEVPSAGKIPLFLAGFLFLGRAALARALCFVSRPLADGDPAFARGSDILTYPPINKDS